MRLIPNFKRRDVGSSTLIVRVHATRPSEAGWVTGQVSLPVPVAWGERVFPAGEYALVVPSWAPLAIVHVQGADHGAMVFAAIVEERAGARTSTLTLIRDEENYRVHALELRDPGIVFYFYSSATADVTRAGRAPSPDSGRLSPDGPARVRIDGVRPLTASDLSKGDLS